MIINRTWAMPTKDTFQCKPINDLITRYTLQSNIIIDPFARNSKIGITNDLNPNTEAQYHLDALDFLGLMKSQNMKAELIFFDPPYSLRQMKEIYEGIGKKISKAESIGFYGNIRNAINEILIPGGIVISFGWNSIGMGKTRGFEIMEVLLVCHGRAHNDTICTVDKKLQGNLL